MFNKVKKRREDLGINQTEFARRCGVSRQAIHAIESGTFGPSVVLALKIAKHLKMSVEELFLLERKD